LNSFDALGLSEPLLRALKSCGYETPTPIQDKAIPPLLEGRDLLGGAQTGTGKTAAFALPILQHMSASQPRGRRKIRALLLTPTRELAAQIGDSFESYGRYLDLRHQVIFGGVKQFHQVRTLEKGVDILVACPGRLLDLHGQGFIDLSGVEYFVLDEADRMLDMGFVHDVRRVLKLLPRRRQNLLFSATMPASIVKLAGSFLNDPVQVEVNPQSSTVERIDQCVMFVEKASKRRLLSWIIRKGEVEQAIVFTRTKHGANRLVQHLEKDGIEARAIHGNKSQGARTKALDAFRSGELAILVATDVASRGIDVDGVSHVFNYDLPNEPESYVHRIGRTGRAGRAGIAIAFCDGAEGEFLRDIEKLTGQEIPVDGDHPWHAPGHAPRKAEPQRGRGRPQPRSDAGGQPRRPEDTSGNAFKPKRRRRRRPKAPAPGSSPGGRSDG
jgi:ATP-dependent RNA helicase RhlE